MPNGSLAASACSRHGERTGHSAHTALAASSSLAVSGKNSSGSSARQLASCVHRPRWSVFVLMRAACAGGARRFLTASAQVKRNRRRRRLLLTTKMLEKAIAAPATTGESSQAIASGMAATL